MEKETRTSWNKGLKGYNKDYPRSEEWCRNISKSKMGHKVLEETRLKLSKHFRKHPNNGMLGKKHSNETKERLRQKALQQFKNGFPEETRRKMRETSIARGVNRGKKNGMFGKSGKEHPTWKGGITPEDVKIRTSIEFRLWREAVFARDNWTCRKCGTRSGNGEAVHLHAHHIQNFSQFPELRTSIENGVTLCKKCHMEFHNKYGRINNTKEQLKEYL